MAHWQIEQLCGTACAKDYTLINRYYLLIWSQITLAESKTAGASCHPAEKTAQFHTCDDLELRDGRDHHRQDDHDCHRREEDLVAAQAALFPADTTAAFWGITFCHFYLQISAAILP